MAALKLFVFAVFVSVAFTGFRIGSDASIPGVDDGSQSDGGDDSAVLEPFKSRIRSLEDRVEEKTQEINDKDTMIAAKEKIIEEKSDSITLLETKISSLRGKLDAAEQMGQAHERAGELEKQVEELKKSINVKIKEKEQLESRVAETDKETSELNSKVDTLQQIIDDQKTKLQNAEQNFKIAEEEIMSAKSEATSKNKELMELHGAWFPPWLAAHFTYCQSLLGKHWEVHGKPSVELLTQKAMEKKARVEAWAAPHVETMKAKYGPAVKQQWIVITNNAKPHVQTITTKTMKIYETSKKAVAPLIIKVVDLVDPYFQELRRVSEPYIGQVIAAARPHVDALKPYTQPALHTYGKFLESATSYHNHVQGRVQEKLESHELTKPLVTKELVWFTASAVLALPILFLMRICSSVFRLV